MSFVPYVKHRNVEGVDLDFLISDCVSVLWGYDTDDPVWLEMRFIRDHLVATGDVVMECGGHRGLTAIMLSKWVGSSGRVVTFEPDARNAEILRQNIELNHLTNVSVEQKAVGARKTKAALSRYSNMETGNLQYIAKKWRRTKGNEVDMVTLDDYVSLNPSLIKIDVEGYELEVLKGAKRILANHPKLAIEVHTDVLKLQGTSVDKLLDCIELDSYEMYVQWDDKEMPVLLDRDVQISGHETPNPWLHIFGIPKNV